MVPSRMNTEQSDAYLRKKLKLLIILNKFMAAIMIFYIGFCITNICEITINIDLYKTLDYMSNDLKF